MPAAPLMYNSGSAAPYGWCRIALARVHRRASPTPPARYGGPLMSDVAPSQTSTGTSDTGLSSAARRAGRYAAYVFWLMFLINFLNYFDRFIFLGLEKSIQKSLNLSDFELGTAVGL